MRNRHFNPNRNAFINRFLFRAVFCALLMAYAFSNGPALAEPVEPHAGVVANLKKIHAAFEAYRKDHDGYYPPLMEKTDGGSRFWPELLKPYLNDGSAKGSVDPKGPFYPPYVDMADRRNGKATSVAFGYSRYALGADAPRNRGRHVVRIVPHPAKTILLVECEALKQPGIGWYSAYPNGGLDFNRYKGKAHVLFCDGHVELWAPGELDIGKRADTNNAPWFGNLSKEAFQKPEGEAGEPTPQAAQESAEMEDNLLPVVTVAPVRKAPVVDGRVGAGEWLDASAFCGYRNYLTRRLDVKDVTTLCGYDAEALYFCFIVPMAPGTEPVANTAKRDGAVYRDDAVEVFLLPGVKEAVRQIIVNAGGMIFDRLGNDPKWDGAWQVAAGRGTADDLPKEEGFDAPAAYWCVEMALPFAELRLPAPKAGAQWRVNFCLDGARPLTFAPTFGTYTKYDQFAYLRFGGENEPRLRLTGLGRVAYGKLNMTGSLANSSGKPVSRGLRRHGPEEGDQGRRDDGLRGDRGRPRKAAGDDCGATGRFDVPRSGPQAGGHPAGGDLSDCNERCGQDAALPESRGLAGAAAVSLDGRELPEQGIP